MVNRRAFLKMSVQSLFDTMKEVAQPLLEDKSDKWEMIQQRLEGRVWVTVSALREDEKLARRMVGKQPLFLVRHARNRLEAIDGWCPTCGSPLSLRMMDHTLLCLPCNKKEQPLKDEAVFPRLPVKQAGEKWLIEVRKQDA